MFAKAMLPACVLGNNYGRRDNFRSFLVGFTNYLSHFIEMCIWASPTLAQTIKLTNYPIENLQHIIPTHCQDKLINFPIASCTDSLHTIIVIILDMSKAQKSEETLHTGTLAAGWSKLGIEVNVRSTSASSTCAL